MARSYKTFRSSWYECGRWQWSASLAVQGQASPCSTYSSWSPAAPSPAPLLLWSSSSRRPMKTWSLTGSRATVDLHDVAAEVWRLTGWYSKCQTTTPKTNILSNRPTVILHVTYTKGPFIATQLNSTRLEQNASPNRYLWRLDYFDFQTKFKSTVCSSHIFTDILVFL